MRLFCDANVGSIIAGALRDAGHDVERAIAVTPDADDADVLAYAVTHGRVLITCDGDFGELVFRSGLLPPPAIIYIRFEPPDVRNIVPCLLPLLDITDLQGHMTVVGAHRDRRTPFPTKSKTHG